MIKIRLPDRSSIDLGSVSAIKPTASGIVLLRSDDTLVSHLKCSDELKPVYLDIFSDLQNKVLDPRVTKDWGTLLEDYREMR